MDLRQRNEMQTLAAARNSAMIATFLYRALPRPASLNGDVRQGTQFPSLLHVVLHIDLCSAPFVIQDHLGVQATSRWYSSMNLVGVRVFYALAVL